MARNATRFVASALAATGASPTAGVLVDDLDMVTLAVVISGTFVGTVKAEGSADGTNWFDWGSARTTPGAIASPGNLSANYIRVNVTAYTSGAINASLVGEPKGK